MKVLVVSEFTGLGSTGYSNYYKEICKALHGAGHEVIELASYGDNNIREHVKYKKSCPWKVILNVPLKSEVQDTQRFHEHEKAKGNAKFGAWAFEVIVAQEKPDVVLAVRDHWYDKFIVESPYAKYYVSLLATTVDSMPQRGDWLSTFGKVDVLTTYNKWSEDWLRQQYSCHNLVEFISPSAADEFKILDKNKCRSELGIPTDIKLVGTVMRNQKRKRFPELFDAVSNTKDVWLYCHTAYPDKGWDIPTLLAQYNVQHRTYMTYMCPKCNNVKAMLYSTRYPLCDKCQNKMETPSARRGVDNNMLCKIYNTMDMYIQPHVAEGFGIPVIEAAKCGVRVISTNYSAQEDVIPRVAGIPLEPLAIQNEIESGQRRAVVDAVGLAKLLNDNSLYTYDRQHIVNTYNENYSWDKTGKKWVDLINSITPKNNWNLKPDIKKPLSFDEISKLNLPNSEYVLTCILYVAHDESLLGSHLHTELLDGLNAGYIILPQDDGLIVQIDRKFVYNRLRSIRENINIWESQREKIQKLQQKKSSSAQPKSSTD